MKFVRVVAAAALAFFVTPADVRAQVTIEYFQGTAINVPMTLTVEQDGFPDISFRAEYSVRPFEDRWYYDARLGFWKGDNGWLIELLHHKAYLENPTEEVEAFEVTHGYNMLTLNRAWKRHGLMFLVGGGAVVPHSNSKVRGRERPITAPYTLAGVTGQAAVGKSVNFTKWLFGSVEGKFTTSWARVPIADGHATVPNIAFHVLAGIGGRF